MRDRSAILDMHTLRLHFCGPGEYDLLSALPPGTESFQCELTPSGHLVLPCSEYPAAGREEDAAVFHQGSTRLGIGADPNLSSDNDSSRA